MNPEEAMRVLEVWKSALKHGYTIEDVRVGDIQVHNGQMQVSVEFKLLRPAYADLEDLDLAEDAEITVCEGGQLLTA